MQRFFEGTTMDDIFVQIVNALKNGDEVKPRGKLVKEIRNCSFELKNPRARMIYHPIRDFSLFYAIGEMCWYLSGSNSVDYISYYSNVWKNLSDDGLTVNSAYGYRIFKGDHPLLPFDQWKHCKQQLINDPDTRQAIIHLHTPNNKKVKDEVCTLCLQFFIRNGKLEMMTTMRSNDIIWGTAYDVFAFTFFQEMMANELGLELGSYHHHAASMHIYEKDFGKIDLLHTHRFVFENPPMNRLEFNRSEHVELLSEVEKVYRTMEIRDPECSAAFSKIMPTNFMHEAMLILQAYNLWKRRENLKDFILVCLELKNVNPMYATFVDRKCEAWIEARDKELKNADDNAKKNN